MTKEAKPADPKGMELSASEHEQLRKEGAREAVKENAKDAYTYLTDGQVPGEATAADKYPNAGEIQQHAFVLEYGVDQFEELISDQKSDRALPDEKVFGLLALERNGQNRTPYVKAMMKRLGLKRDELPGGGPDYTNDLTAISKL